MYDGISSVQHHEDVSEIQSYFSGKSVFVTGVTGFLGKLIIEKLLRSCNVKKIYLLMREKKGKEPNERLKELCDIPAFEPLKKLMPNFIDKLVLCVGDCLEPELGLSQEDTSLLKEEVNCIVHCAATVRFDASLRKATYINIRATRDLLRMAKDMKKLTSFVHVSTAYSHCPRKDIDEKIYDPPIKEQNLMSLVEALDDDVLDAITPTLLGQWPNTYVFTKAVADEVVKIEGRGLPISIVKPSIAYHLHCMDLFVLMKYLTNYQNFLHTRYFPVIASVKEPVPGWIDNFYGVTGVAMAVGLGIMRTLHCTLSKKADVVPADYVVNTMLAAAWDVSQRSIENQADPTVYNYVSGFQNPITWDSYMKLVIKSGTKVPPSLTVWHWNFIAIKNLHLYLLSAFLLHTVPAYFVDFILLCIGKKPRLVDGYKKIDKFGNVLSYFANRQWNFKDVNVQTLWNKLNARDKEMFEFDIKGIDWDEFFYTYLLGCRIYLLKDPVDTLPYARLKWLFLRIAHYILLAVLGFLLYLLLKFLFKFLFSINY